MRWSSLITFNVAEMKYTICYVGSLFAKEEHVFYINYTEYT